MIFTIKRDSNRMQALFLLILWIASCCANANQMQPLSQELKKIFLSIENKRNFSNEFSQLNALSPQEKRNLVQIWDSPAYPWKWRWFSVMYMAENMMPGYEKSIVQGLQDPLFLIRLASIKALAVQSDLEKYYPYLILRLKDNSLVVRKAAIQALSLRPNQQVVREIEKAMFDDKNRLHNQQDLMGILQSMLDLIVRYNNKQSIHTLAKLMQKSNIQSDFKIQVCNALTHLVRRNFSKRDYSVFNQKGDCQYQWQRWYYKYQDTI